jgi:hypothetical protein
MFYIRLGDKETLCIVKKSQEEKTLNVHNYDGIIGKWSYHENNREKHSSGSQA